MPCGHSISRTKLLFLTRTDPFFLDSPLSAQGDWSSDSPPCAVAGGWSHSVAVTQGGVAYTWGCGSEGRLGSGCHSDSLLPMEVRLSQCVCSAYIQTFVFFSGVHTRVLTSLFPHVTPHTGTVLGESVDVPRTRGRGCCGGGVSDSGCEGASERPRQRRRGHRRRRGVCVCPRRCRRGRWRRRCRWWWR